MISDAEIAAIAAIGTAVVVTGGSIVNAVIVRGNRTKIEEFGTQASERADEVKAALRTETGRVHEALQTETGRMREELQTETGQSVGSVVENIQVNIRDHGGAIHHLQDSVVVLHDMVGSVRRSQERTESSVNEHIRESKPIREYVETLRERDELARGGELERRNGSDEKS